MAPRPVQLRARAASDIDSAVDYYQREAGVAVALEFIESLEQSVSRIRRSPHIGSLRFSYELDIPELRAWPLARFPYLVFYVERERENDVWRVLHTRRDLPASLADIDER